MTKKLICQNNNDKNPTKPTSANVFVRSGNIYVEGLQCSACLSCPFKSTENRLFLDSRNEGRSLSKAVTEINGQRSHRHLYLSDDQVRLLFS